MVYNPDIHHRRSIRLPTHDYASVGAYFITVCTRHREQLFGDVADCKVRLNSRGRIVEQVWRGLPDHYPHVVLDAFVAMPDHIHGILVLSDENKNMGSNDGAGASVDGVVGAQLNCTPTNRQRNPLGHIVRSLKSFSTRHINEIRGTPGCPVWQRNYYERIIRDDMEMARTRWYIHQNPANWHRDRNGR